MLSYIAVLSRISSHYVLFLILAQSKTCCGAEKADLIADQAKTTIVSRNVFRTKATGQKM